MPGSSHWVSHRLPRAGRLFGATAYWTGTQVLFFGGSSCPPDAPCPPPIPSQPPAPVPSYNPATGRWKMLTGNVALSGGGPTVWTGRAVAVVNGGGNQGSFDTNTMLKLGDSAVFDPSTDHWLDLPPYPYGSLYNASAIWTGDSVIVWGGVYRGPSNGGVLS